MTQTVRATSLKNIEKCSEPYYVKEIVPYVVERWLFQTEDMGRLGKSADQMGMAKIRAKTSGGKYVVEYLNKATIHGLNHIAAPHRHFIERILVVLFVTVALALTVMLSLYSWDHYQNDACSMVLDYDPKNFDIIKPAVTICLYDPISSEKFPEVFDKFGVEDTPEAREFFLFISRPSYETLNQTPIYKAIQPEKWIEILQDLYVDFDLHTWYPGADEESNLTATHVVTEKGICTTAFGVYSEYSTLEYWFSNNWTVFPVKNLPAWTYSHRNDLMMIHDIPGPSTESIALHHPNDLSNYQQWNRNNGSGVVNMVFTVQQSEGSEQIKQLSQSQRPCNFHEDGNLKMWPVYTRHICLMECRYNLIKSKCGCYPYFARPMNGIPVCNVTQLHCIGNIAATLVSLKIDGSSICNCPVDCDTVVYRLSSRTESNTKTDIAEFLDRRSLNLNIEFPYFILRYELFFGFNEFVVSVGGAAGLFLGASIISFVEILYYATLRLFWYKMKIPKDRRQ